VIVAAIDPGDKGGWAVYSTDGKDSATYIEHRNGCPVSQVLEDLVNTGVTHVILENLETMPGKGTATSWTTSGIDWGGLYHTLQWNKIGVTTVRSAAWKKHHGLTGKDKKASIELARQFFPGISLRRTPKCTTDADGVAEALLMLKYGLEKGLFV
jgi:hypothetical protein